MGLKLWSEIVNLLSLKQLNFMSEVSGLMYIIVHDLYYISIIHGL